MDGADWWQQEEQEQQQQWEQHMSENNLALWRSVEKTDPQYTKPFSRGGGFRGTAVNGTYLARKATEAFGPMGIGWGLEILDEELMQGAPLGDGAFEQVHKVRVKRWYVLGDQGGGLSGRPLQQRATDVVHHLHRRLQGRIPIIGIGGIVDAASALEKLQAGASLVQLYSGLVYRGPTLLDEVLTALWQQKLRRYAAVPA